MNRQAATLPLPPAQRICLKDDDTSDLASAIILAAVMDLKACYPRKRMVRPKAGGAPQKIHPATLAAERREFCEAFESALEFFFGEDRTFELLADSLEGVDAARVRDALVPVLERRRYATDTPDRCDYVPVYLRDHWRVLKRRWNFYPGFGSIGKRPDPIEATLLEGPERAANGRDRRTWGRVKYGWHCRRCGAEIVWFRWVRLAEPRPEEPPRDVCADCLARAAA